MDTLFGLVVIFGFMVAFLFLVIRLWTVRSGSVHQKDDAMLYFVKFKGINPPDMANNAIFNKVAKIKNIKGDTYQIISTINDSNLKKLIMEEFQLSSSQVIVYYPPRLFFYA
ncbi:TPA: hypothetical protein ACGO7S_001971 [Streptococcus suis]